MWRFLRLSCRESSTGLWWRVREMKSFSTSRAFQVIHAWWNVPVSSYHSFIFQEVTSKPTALACVLAETWSICWMYPFLLCVHKILFIAPPIYFTSTGTFRNIHPGIASLQNIKTTNWGVTGTSEQGCFSWPCAFQGWIQKYYKHPWSHTLSWFNKRSKNKDTIC